MAYVYRHFIPQNTAQKGAKSIGVYNADGEKVIDIPLGRMTPPKTEPLYSFGLVSDCHTYRGANAKDGNWKGNVKLDNALSFFESKNCVMCVGCGDITQTGFYLDTNGTRDTLQFENYAEILAKHTIPVFELYGNHENFYNMDIEVEAGEAYTGIPATAYTVSSAPETDEAAGTTMRPNKYADVRDELFILLSQPSYNKVMSDDDFQWLAKTLEDNADRRCFVFIHSYIEEDSGDAGDYRENSIFQYWGTAKRTAFMDLLKQYDNVILFHGHSHIKFECQELDKDATYTEKNGFKSVHIPSLGRPRNIDESSATTPYADSESQGYIVDVYDDCIVLNGIDLINNKPIPLGTFKIDIKGAT